MIRCNNAGQEMGCPPGDLPWSSGNRRSRRERQKLGCIGLHRPWQAHPRHQTQSCIGATRSATKRDERLSAAPGHFIHSNQHRHHELGSGAACQGSKMSEPNAIQVPSELSTIFRPSVFRGGQSRLTRPRTPFLQPDKAEGGEEGIVGDLKQLLLVQICPVLCEHFFLPRHPVSYTHLTLPTICSV